LGGRACPRHENRGRSTQRPPAPDVTAVKSILDSRTGHESASQPPWAWRPSRRTGTSTRPDFNSSTEFARFRPSFASGTSAACRSVVRFGAKRRAEHVSSSSKAMVLQRAPFPSDARASKPLPMTRADFRLMDRERSAFCLKDRRGHLRTLFLPQMLRTGATNRRCYRQPSAACPHPCPQNQ
jgi:hypothetical protein